MSFPRPALTRTAAASRHLETGFSLIELLLVVAIVGILSVLAIGGFNQTVRGTKITSTAQGVADALGLARNSALARNTPVQIRFYKFPTFDAATNSAPDTFRGLQIFACESRTTNAITRPFLFPNPVIASKDATKSSILQQTEFSGTGAVSGYSNYKYVTLTFGSDGMIRTGSSQLTTTNEFFITLQAVLDTDNSTWPKNYATVSVNPVTGNTKIFQPR